MGTAHGRNVIFVSGSGLRRKTQARDMEGRPNRQQIQHSMSAIALDRRERSKEYVSIVHGLWTCAEDRL